MEIIFEQVFILLAFAAVGFLLAKCGIAKSSHADLLSKLLVYVFLPANIFKTFAQNCTVAYVADNYILLLASFAILLVLVLTVHFGTRLCIPTSPDRAVYEYSLMIPNFGYMGYTFAETLFGSAGLMDAMMFSMPMSLYVYTIGYVILSGKKPTPKNLLNPMILSLLLGALVGLTGTGAYIPEVTYTLLDKASACMAPVSMLLLGLVLSEYKLGEMLKRPSVYLVSALRLFAIPVLLGAVLSFFKISTLTSSAVLLYCMPCGLNTIVFVKNAGGDCRPGAALALVSNLLACVSIPLVLYIFGIHIL